MSSYKEIITKAVIGKGKKTFTNKYSLVVPNNVDTVLGCWVINHNIFGSNDSGMVLIKGNFDVNIWYSYDNNTKTAVATENVGYEEKVSVKLRNEDTLTDNSEIIVRALRNPNCIDATCEGNKINYEIEKEIGIEIVGDTKVRILTDSEIDDYDILENVVDPKEVSKEIDESVNEEFLKEK
jgi:spore coat protein E